MTAITARRSGSHCTYYADGVKLPGGSTIAGMTPKDLSTWYAGQAAEYAVEHWDRLTDLRILDRVKAIQSAPRESVTRSAKRGSECHDVMDRLIRGLPASTDDPTVLADAEAAARLLDAWQIAPAHSEVGLANLVQMYGGTADLIATSPFLADGQQCLLDHKFGTRTYPSHAIQLSAYAHSTHMIDEVEQRGPRGGRLKPRYDLAPMPDLALDTAYILHAHDGVAELVPLRIDGWVWDCVLICTDLYWEWEHRCGWNARSTDSYESPIGDPLTPPTDLPPMAVRPLDTPTY